MPPSSEALSTHPRYETLDGMRGVAAICVMVFHYVKGSRHPFLNNAHLAVDLFFMLSGFVIAHSYGKRVHLSMGALEYAGRRLIRLYPMFLAGLFLGAPVLYGLQNSALSTSTPGFIVRSLAVNVFYLPSFNDYANHNFGFPSTTIGQVFPTNPPAWSLFFEMVASAAFLVLVRFKRKELVATVAGSFTIFAIAGIAYPLLNHRHECDLDLGWNLTTFWGGFPRVIYGFSAGLLLHSLATDASLASLRAYVERLLKSPSVLYLLLIFVFMFPIQLRGLYPFFILAIVAPALVFGGSLVRCHSAGSLKIAKFLGWISYPVYCLHFPIGNAVFLVAAHAHLPHRIAIIAAIVLSLFASVVLTRYYEEPLRAYLTRQFIRRADSARPAIAMEAKL